RDALSGALRAAHEIRARAENAAQQILEQARDERKMLIKEIERLREERDSLADEIASNRRSGFSALRGPRREAAVPQEKASEETTPDSRALAADALRGAITELLEDTRRPAGPGSGARGRGGDAGRAGSCAGGRSRPRSGRGAGGPGGGARHGRGACGRGGAPSRRRSPRRGRGASRAATA